MNLLSTLIGTKQTQGNPSLTGTDGTASSSYLDSALALWGKGADIYTEIKGIGKTPVTPSGLVTNPVNPPAPSPWKQYLPLTIVGVVALVILYFVVRKS